MDALTPPDSVAEHDTPREDIRLIHGPSKSIITSGRRVASYQLFRNAVEPAESWGFVCRCRTSSGRAWRPSLSLSTRFSPHSPRSPTRLSRSPLRSPWKLLAGPSLGSPSSPHHQQRPSPRLSPTRTSQENEPPSRTKSSERRRSGLGSKSSLSSLEKPHW